MELPVPEAPTTSDPFECLPEHVIHRILSLVPSCREVAGTALISRSWWRVWSSFPVFDFDLREFFLDDLDRMSDDKMLEVTDQFLGFVDRAVSRLREQGIPLRRLKVWTWVLETGGSHQALFNKWIAMALEDGVEELHIGVRYRNEDARASVPVFSSDCLKTLTLEDVRYRDGASTVNLNSLNSLELRYVWMDDQMLEKLLRGCPLLENVTLYLCESLGQMKISGPSKLKMFAFTGFPDRVEINLPNLEKLEFSVPASHADKVVLSGCRQLKHLTFESAVGSQEQLEELLSKFPLLESLTIGWGTSFGRIRISHPMLEKIEVLEFEMLKEIGIDAPRLLSFRYSTIGARLPIVRMANPASVSNCEAKFVLYSRNCDFIELRKSLEQSCAFTSLSFSGDFWEARVDAPSASSPCDIRHLNLRVGGPQSSWPALLDGLLSISRPTTMRVNRFDHDTTFLEFLCRKLANRENDTTECLCSCDTKCWLHKLKGVEIERITESDHEGPLDWTTLFELLPTLDMNNEVCFRLYW